MAKIRYTVQVLHIPDEEPRTPTVLATYEDVQAGSVIHARQVGLHRYLAEHPDADWSLVYGSAHVA